MNTPPVSIPMHPLGSPVDRLATIGQALIPLEKRWKEHVHENLAELRGKTVRELSTIFFVNYIGYRKDEHKVWDRNRQRLLITARELLANRESESETSRMLVGIALDVWLGRIVHNDAQQFPEFEPLNEFNRLVQYPVDPAFLEKVAVSRAKTEAKPEEEVWAMIERFVEVHSQDIPQVA